MGRGRSGILTQSEKRKKNELKRFGTILKTFGNIPREEIELDFSNTMHRPNYLVNLASPEMIRAAQSLTLQQLAALIPNKKENFAAHIPKQWHTFARALKR